MAGAPGRQVGPWTLGEQLGRGGNAAVFVASGGGVDTPVALKAINTTKVEREPYQRFVREIGFLRAHQDVGGLLPLIDAYLPVEPSKDDQPWLAMPVATPIAVALQGRPLPGLSWTSWADLSDFGDVVPCQSGSGGVFGALIGR